MKGNGESRPSSAVDETNIVLSHWGEHVNGGGDRVAWELTRVFDGAPLYVGWRDRNIEPEDVESTQLISGPFSEWALRRGGIARMFAHLIGWQKATPLREFDVHVSSGNEPLFYVPPTDQIWVAYVHHTNRRQSDQIDRVPDGVGGNLTLLFYYLIRMAFDHNTHRPDLFVTNSEPVKRRVIRYWGVPEERVEVVYPPVDTHKYDPADANTEDYYVTLSRLDWHKNVEEIVRAFNETPERTLYVAGDGPERERLERISSDNVHVEGYVSQARKRELLSGARAFVFNASDEDFGISPVEALAAGTPLIGVREGMTRFQVVDGKNGVSYDRGPTPVESIQDAVSQFERDGVEWSEGEISSFANRFSVDAFHENMWTVVEKAVDQSDVVPEWYVDLTD